MTLLFIFAVRVKYLTTVKVVILSGKVTCHCFKILSVSTFQTSETRDLIETISASF